MLATPRKYVGTLLAYVRALRTPTGKSTVVRRLFPSSHNDADSTCVRAFIQGAN